MQDKIIAECSKGSILQYFQPSLSSHLSLRLLFCLFLSGRLRQVLQYIESIPQLYIELTLVRNSVQLQHQNSLPL